MNGGADSGKTPISEQPPSNLPGTATKEVKSFIREVGHQKWMVIACEGIEITERLPRHWANLPKETSVWLMAQAAARMQKKLARRFTRPRGEVEQ